jgi:hypothetical protein
MDNPKELARRLTVGLDDLAARESQHITANEAGDLAATAARFHQQLTSLPDAARQRVQTANSGSAASGAWADEAIQKQNDEVKKLARAAAMVATWLGPNGAVAERSFVIRGNIRGWAHRWSKEDKGAAQVDTDPAFVAFASDCLTQAAIAGYHKAIVTAALGADWRTAAHTADE